MTPELTITDSGVRRIGRSVSSSIRKFVITYILPTTMAPRKKTDEDSKPVPVVDPSAMVWRAFVTVILVTICPWTRPFLGVPPDANASDRRITALEEKMDKVTDRINALIDGVNSQGGANNRWPRK